MMSKIQLNILIPDFISVMFCPSVLNSWGKIIEAKQGITWSQLTASIVSSWSSQRTPTIQ